MEVTFTFDKETPGTMRFREDHPASEPPQVGSLYIKRYTFAALGNPQTIKVTITKKD